MYANDAEGLPTGELVHPAPRPWDYCFVELAAAPRLRWGGLDVTMESDCPCWIVYDREPQAVAVEPWTAPPNSLNMPYATIVEPGRPLVATMTWRWDIPGQPQVPSHDTIGPPWPVYLTPSTASLTRATSRCRGSGTCTRGSMLLDQPPAMEGELMSLPQTAGGYALGPGEGEAVWFNGGLGLLRATAKLTDGRFAAMELLAPKGFASPLHIHRDEDEFFLVLSGEVRVRHGEEVIEAVAGSLVYGPRGIAHAFRVDSLEARLLLFFGPAGVEGFFREAGKPARSRGLPPVGEQFLDRDALKEIGGRYHQEFVGPPLPPKD